jgi:hypothetical protein
MVLPVCSFPEHASRRGALLASCRTGQRLPATHLVQAVRASRHSRRATLASRQACGAGCINVPHTTLFEANQSHEGHGARAPAVALPRPFVASVWLNHASCEWNPAPPVTGLQWPVTGAHLKEVLGPSGQLNEWRSGITSPERGARSPARVGLIAVITGVWKRAHIPWTGGKGQNGLVSIPECEAPALQHPRPPDRWTVYGQPDKKQKTSHRWSCTICIPRKCKRRPIRRSTVQNGSRIRRNDCL